MDVTNVRANCCEHKTRVNKCRLCYNAYFQAYRKKIAEIENSKVQTRNKVNAKRSKYASVLCIDCKDLTKSNFCRECSLKYASVQMNHCRYKARQKKLMQCQKSWKDYHKSQNYTQIWQPTNILKNILDIILYFFHVE